MIAHAFLFALILFPGYILLHAMMNRFTGSQGFLRNAAQLWFAFAGASHLFIAFINARFALACLCFSMSYWCFYMLVLVAARNSVTLRMMDEIYEAKGLTPAELDIKVPDGESVITRIRAMEQRGGLLVKSGNAFELTPRGSSLGSLAMKLRKLFSLERAG